MMKRESICSPKGVEFIFNDISGRAVDQGKLKASKIYAKCVLIMPLILSAEDGRCSENAVE